MNLLMARTGPDSRWHLIIEGKGMRWDGHEVQACKQLMYFHGPWPETGPAVFDPKIPWCRKCLRSRVWKQVVPEAAQVELEKAELTTRLRELEHET